MSTFRATPKIPRSSTAYLMASACAAVALNMAFLPLGMAAANAASSGRTIDRIAAGTDHSAIAADAFATGDAETVEMSIAAYDRVSIAAYDRVSVAADDRVSIAADDRAPELAPSR